MELIVENDSQQQQNQQQEGDNADPVQTRELANQTLFEAAQFGNLDRVDYLIRNGLATANDKDAENCTALHWACIVSWSLFII